jgi:hypothetical protein
MDVANERRRAFLRIASGLAVAPLLADCGSLFDIVYRYRITVYVDTASGPRSGSSVIEIRCSPARPLSVNSPMRLRGEAVAVDLPDGQTLFALLGSRAHESAAELYPYAAYHPPVGRGTDWKTDAEFLARQTRPALLPADHLPPLVRFRDPTDARTVELVDPANLSASFGPGVRLNRVEIQITQDPVTSTIEGRLPSYRDGSGHAQWQLRLPYTDPRQLDKSDFRRGF